MLKWLAKNRFLKHIKKLGYEGFLHAQTDELLTNYKNHQQINKTNPGCDIHLTVRLVNPQNITVGEKTHIGSHCLLHGGGYEWSDGKGSIVIGKQVTISPRCVFFGAGEIEIGDNTGFGVDVKVMAQTEGSFHNPQTDYKLEFEKVIIGKGCIIGSGAVILAGTILGDNCIVGPNSVVQGKYDANTTIVGNPARVIPRVVKF